MSSPVNPIKAPSRVFLLAKLQDKLGLDVSEMQQLQQLFQKTDVTLNLDGSIKPQVNVSGRTDQLQTTLGNITATGQLNSLGNVVDTNTDHLTDGTGTPLAGGKRGAIALNTNNQLSSSFREQPVNVMAVSVSASILSNDGVSKAIVIAASSIQFGAGVISYNAGSVNPGVFGTFYIYASDPTFAGGAVTYQFATTVQTTASGDGFVFFGKITTVNGTPNTGGGQTGGTTPGGFGGNRGA